MCEALGASAEIATSLSRSTCAAGRVADGRRVAWHDCCAATPNASCGRLHIGWISEKDVEVAMTSHAAWSRLATWIIWYNL